MVCRMLCGSMYLCLPFLDLCGFLDSCESFSRETTGQSRTTELILTLGILAAVLQGFQSHTWLRTYIRIIDDNHLITVSPVAGASLSQQCCLLAGFPSDGALSDWRPCGMRVPRPRRSSPSLSLQQEHALHRVSGQGHRQKPLRAVPHPQCVCEGSLRKMTFLGFIQEGTSAEPVPSRISAELSPNRTASSAPSAHLPCLPSLSVSPHCTQVFSQALPWGKVNTRTQATPYHSGAK